MPAAVPRTNGDEQDNREFKPGDTSTPVKLEAVSEDYEVTALMRAACDGSAGTVQALLDRGVQVNAKRTDGFNALALAAFFGHSQIVWLLLENGADLAAAGRLETLPETWADVRGFPDTGNIIREARSTKHVQVPSPPTAVALEPARFPRRAENEKPQRTNVPHSGLESSVIDDASDSERTFARPAWADAYTVAESEATADLSNEGPRHAPEQLTLMQSPGADLSDLIDDPEITLVKLTSNTGGKSARKKAPAPDVITAVRPKHVSELQQPLQFVRMLPEIEDPPPLPVPEFNPRAAFVARVTSSRKNLIALVIAVWIASSCVAYFLIPQIRKSLANRQTEVVTQPSTAAMEPSSPVPGSETNVSGLVESPTADTTGSTTAATLDDVNDKAPETTTESTNDTGHVQSTTRSDSVEVSEKSGAGQPRSTGSENRAQTSSTTYADNTFPETQVNKIATTSLSRSAASARKRPDVSRPVKSKRQKVGEEQPKPAPLTVEASRSHSVVSVPAPRASEVPAQSAPMSIISDKPKSKVIQWP